MLGIEYIRRQLEMSITDLAKLLSVSRQIVSKWEKGEKKIPDKRLKELSEICGIPQKYFSKEIEFADKINITSLINNQKQIEKDIILDVYSKLPEEFLEAIRNEEIDGIEKICDEENEMYIAFVDYCKEKITLAQRKMIMDISMCENRARNNSSDDVKKLYYYSWIYSSLADIILNNPQKIKVIANVLREFAKEDVDDKQSNDK